MNIIYKKKVFDFQSEKHPVKLDLKYLSIVVLINNIFT